MTAREQTHGFLPNEGMRVMVTGTRHHGFRGTVLPAREGQAPRAVLVQLDEFDEPVVLYTHNLILESLLP